MTSSVSEDIHKARTLARAGRRGPARRAYRNALRNAPNDPDLLMEAGFLEVGAQRFSDARNFMLKALELRPNDPDIHFNAAETFRLAGRGAEAKRHFRQAIELRPDDGEAHHALADLCAAAGEWEDARRYIETAHRLIPDHPDILNLMGIVHERNGDPAKAEDCFAKAVEMKPDHVNALCNLGGLAVERERFSEAVKHYEKADGIAPLAERQLYDLFSACRRLNMGDKALRIGERLVAASRGTGARALVARGGAHEAMGRFDDAERDYRAAIRADAGNTDAYENLGTMGRLTPEDAEALEKIAQDPGRGENKSPGLWFALYKAHDGAGNHDRAFEVLRRANDLKVEDHPPDRDNIVARATVNRETYDREFLAARRDCGYGKPGPIYIVGMPRSGTTLIERILAAHPQVRGTGERRDLPNLIRAIADYPSSMTDKTAAWYAQTGQAIHRALFAAAGNETFVTDKLPGNFQNVGLIFLILPKAKIVYCKRDALDNCLSCYEQNFGGRLNYTFNLATLAEAYRQHEKTMDHWFEMFPGRIHTVNYETLVTEPEPVVRAMLDHVGLEWDPRCLRPQDVDGAIATASIWQARQPINPNSVGRWRRYEKHLKPLAEALKVP